MSNTAFKEGVVRSKKEISISEKDNLQGFAAAAASSISKLHPGRLPPFFLMVRNANMNPVFHGLFGEEKRLRALNLFKSTNDKGNGDSIL